MTLFVDECMATNPGAFFGASYSPNSGCVCMQTVNLSFLLTPLCEYTQCPSLSPSHLSGLSFHIPF